MTATTATCLALTASSADSSGADSEMADLCNTTCQCDAAPSGPAIAPPTHQRQRRIIRAVPRSGSSARAGERGKLYR